MATSVLSGKEVKKNGGEVPKWVTVLVCGIIIVAFGCAIIFATMINGGGKSSSGSSTASKPTAEEIKSKLEDECITKATENVKDSKVDITTISGLLDADSNEVGKNRNGDSMTLYRWYGEKDGEKIMFACYAAADSDGNIGVASVSMGLDIIYQNSRFDFADN